MTRDDQRYESVNEWLDATYGAEDAALERAEILKATLAANLRRLRKERGLTQGELADKVGVGQPAISKAEDPDRNWTIDTMLKHLAALDAELLVALRRTGRREVYRLSDSAAAQGLDAASIGRCLRGDDMLSKYSANARHGEMSSGRSPRPSPVVVRYEDLRKAGADSVIAPTDVQRSVDKALGRPSKVSSVADVKVS